MCYSYEFKRKCVELYRSGHWLETPNGIKQENFRKTIHKWVRLEDANGLEVLQHKNCSKSRMVEDRLEIVIQVIAGRSIKSDATENGIPNEMLSQWGRKYKIYGYRCITDVKKSTGLLSNSQML